MIKSNPAEIISIKDFYFVYDFERYQINHELESNYIKYSDSNLGYNFPIYDYQSKFFDNLYDKFLETSHNIFGNFSLSEKNSRTCYCYRSIFNEPDSHISPYHDHKNSSTINGVYYYQVNEGDSIIFLDENFQKFVYYLTEGEMLIFPNDLLHKPNIPVATNSHRYRYSINVELITEETSEELFNRI